MKVSKLLLITITGFLFFTAPCYADMVTHSVSAYYDSYELSQGNTQPGTGELLHLFDVTFDDSKFLYHIDGTPYTGSFWDNPLFMSDATFVFDQAFIDIYMMLGMQDPSTITTPSSSWVEGIGSPGDPTIVSAYNYHFYDSPGSIVFRTEGYWSNSTHQDESLNVYNNYYFGVEIIDGNFTYVLTWDSVASFSGIKIEGLVKSLS